MTGVLRDSLGGLSYQILEMIKHIYTKVMMEPVIFVVTMIWEKQWNIGQEFVA